MSTPPGKVKVGDTPLLRSEAPGSPNETAPTSHVSVSQQRTTVTQPVKNGEGDASGAKILSAVTDGSATVGALTSLAVHAVASTATDQSSGEPVNSNQSSTQQTASDATGSVVQTEPPPFPDLSAPEDSLTNLASYFHSLANFAMARVETDERYRVHVQSGIIHDLYYMGKDPHGKNPEYTAIAEDFLKENLRTILFCVYMFCPSRYAEIRNLLASKYVERSTVIDSCYEQVCDVKEATRSGGFFPIKLPIQWANLLPDWSSNAVHNHGCGLCVPHPQIPANATSTEKTKCLGVFFARLALYVYLTQKQTREYGYDIHREHFLGDSTWAVKDMMKKCPGYLAFYKTIKPLFNFEMPTKVLINHVMENCLTAIFVTLFAANDLQGIQDFKDAWIYVASQHSNDFEKRKKEIEDAFELAKKVTTPSNYPKAC
ncbi:MAG: hypothetical protein LBP65_02235 [Puniceicoccales bacterium]|jgi:hypothetical protein|nr:hypothetical protein [Puniceicoccales bacterium]